MRKIHWDREKNIKKKKQSNRKRKSIKKSKNNEKIIDGWGIFKEKRLIKCVVQVGNNKRH